MIHPNPSTTRRAPAKKSVREARAPTPPARPTARSLTALREEAQHCRACPLWKNATQTVFGEGRATARIVLIGEQPGDREDLVGKPFVGPAGKLLDRALERAGVERTQTYVTNAVKHFKFEPRGKRRIHKKPNEQEISVCRQHWLDNELRLIGPTLVIAMGATAARAVFGRATAIGKNRGHVIKGQSLASELSADVIVTVHPSYLLRVPDADRDSAFEEFVTDLKLARQYAPA
ncbi:UdgX family uracil-DNA binding protein [Steroidobacter cummioxidans]|uniref:UdgX family uracil-DNA binding protein n=1 Tax=Steroidobacter cummioxidans TaxID=1803913 RepID=UPI000E30CCF7